MHDNFWIAFLFYIITYAKHCQIAFPTYRLHEMIPKTLVVIMTLKIKPRGNPCPETLSSVAFCTFDMPVNSLQICSIIDLYTRLFHLFGENGLLTIEKDLFIKKNNTFNKVHTNH